MDLALSFVFARLMKGFTSDETAENLLAIISFTGPPSAILSDQGSNFLSKVLSQLYDKFAIQRIKTSPYRPQSNGQLERVHSTLKTVLRKIIADKHDWPLVLDLVLYFLRNLPHSRHGHTPYELIFMKPTPHILATLKSYWFHPENESLNASVFLESLHHNINTTIQTLKERLRDDTAKKRATSDNRKFRKFKEGYLVWRCVPGLNACLEASWEGPFVVLSKLTDVNYKIAPKGSKGKSRGKVVHLNHLKVC